MESVEDAITVSQAEKLKNPYSIQETLTFSFNPMIPSLNYHYQYTDVPSFEQDDLQEPVPPVEQKVEWMKIDDHDISTS